MAATAHTVTVSKVDTPPVEMPVASCLQVDMLLDASDVTVISSLASFPFGLVGCWLRMHRTSGSKGTLSSKPVKSQVKHLHLLLAGTARATATACTNNNPCPPVNCVGSWIANGVCSGACGGGAGKAALHCHCSRLCVYSSLVMEPSMLSVYHSTTTLIPYPWACVSTL